MQVHTLTTDAEFQTYATRFSETILERSKGAVVSSVPLDYLRRCPTVRGVYSSTGEMIGGYAIGAGMPLRLLEFVPDDALATLSPPGGETWDACCEIACMWRTDALTHALMDRSVWPRIAVDSVLAGKRYILGHNQNRGLDRRYTRLGMKTLYEGRSSKGHDSRLFFYTRTSMSTLIALRTIALPWLLLRRTWG